MVVAEAFSLCAEAADDGERAAGYMDKAFEAANASAALGYANVAELERDPDCDPMRGDERFGPLLGRVRANAAKER